MGPPDFLEYDWCWGRWMIGFAARSDMGGRELNISIGPLWLSFYVARRR